MKFVQKIQILMIDNSVIGTSSIQHSAIVQWLCKAE